MNRAKAGFLSALDRALPSRLKKAIVHTAFHSARRQLADFLYAVPTFYPSMETSLRGLASRGFTPRTVVDVGAFRGDWSRLAHKIWPHASLYMIEPNFGEKPVVSAVAKEIGANVFFDLIGAETGKQVQFNVMQAGSETGTSVLNERSNVRRTVETRALSTLDSLPISFVGCSLLKVDTQGYEIEVLRGATRSIQNFDAVILEVALIEINEGAPTMLEVLSYMNGLGFVPYEIAEIHRRPLDSATSQIDLIFVRRESFLIADKRYSV